jgi:hypothetical protein
MKFVKDKALGMLPNLDKMLRILNIQILEIYGRLPVTKKPSIPEVIP